MSTCRSTCKPFRGSSRCVAAARWSPSLLALWALRAAPAAQPQPLPTEWALTRAPGFHHRRAARLPAAARSAAAPHRAVEAAAGALLPADRSAAKFATGTTCSARSTSTFAVCSANGRVLAAIDLDTDRGNSRRVLQIKQSVLGACRVRYLRCPVDHLPSVAELQLLVPSSDAAARGPQPAPRRRTTCTRRATRWPAPSPADARERTALWQDSTFFQDSFFAPDNRLDAPRRQRASPLGGRRAAAPRRHRSDARRGRTAEPGARRHRRRRRRHAALTASAPLTLATRAYDARAMTALRRPERIASTPYAEPDARRRCSTRSTASACAATAGCSSSTRTRTACSRSSWKTAASSSPSSIGPAAGATRRSSRSTRSPPSSPRPRSRSPRRWRSTRRRDSPHADGVGLPGRRWRSSTRRPARYRFAVARASRRPRAGARRPADAAWLGRFIGRLHAVGARGRFEHRDDARRRDASATQRATGCSTATSLPPTQLPALAATLATRRSTTSRDAFDAGAGAAHAAPARRLPPRQRAVDATRGPHFVDLDDAVHRPGDAGPVDAAVGRPRRDDAPARRTCSTATRRSWTSTGASCALIEPLRTLRMIHHSAWIARRWSDPAFPVAFPVVRQPGVLGRADARSCASSSTRWPSRRSAAPADAASAAQPPAAR